MLFIICLYLFFMFHFLLILLIQSLRAFRRAVSFGLLAWWVVGLLFLRLSVCSFDRGGFLCTCRELALGASWAPFWELWGSLGHHFGVSGPIHFGGLGAPLGFIFGALGLLWRLWGSLGAPLAAQGAQSQIFPLFSLPCWAHFGSILEVTIDEKFDVIFS